MKKLTLLISFIAIFVIIFFADEFSKGKDDFLVSSPDGNVTLELIIMKNGIPGFNIYSGMDTVMLNNKLGLILEDTDFSKNLQLITTSPIEKIEDSYDLISGKKVHCSYQGNKRIFHLINPDDKKLDIIFQVSNDGVGFHYYLPGESEVTKKINDELTYFNFNKNTVAWIQPMAAAKSGWNSVNPSYEEHYYNEIKITNLPNNKPGWVFPAFFKSNNYWISITETAPDRNYCGCRIMHDSLDTGFKIGFPQEKESIFNGKVNPESNLPWNSPWRIITVGKNLNTLIESTLGTDLSKPSSGGNYSYVKPGRASWSWISLKDDSITYPVQKRFIDYASEMGWEYCLIDANWDWKIGYDNIAELSSYASTKGVGLILWYNSAGDWNTTPYTPRDKLLTQEQRYKEFKKLNEMGIKGVKVDFFGGDGQSVISNYQDVIEDAAKFNLMVNCHGSTLPRGWQRTYPNLVTMEAILGFEFVTFEQIHADMQAQHCTIIPFARNLFDPMDFTPVCFSEVPNIKRKTTNSFELALSVLFTSGIQHYAEKPEGMKVVPDYVKQFLKEVPVNWDESKFVDGYPGKYVVVARRKNNTWYIAGINGEQNEKALVLNLGFIKHPLESLLITCGTDNRSFNLNTDVFDTKEQFKITLKPQDGFLSKIVEQ